MTQQQIVREFEGFSKAEKSAVIRQLLQIFEKDLSDENPANGLKVEPFTVNSLRLYPHREFNLDNIGKLLEEVEGDFYK
jgi:hypothetical protein